jgi:hypothetical protein
VFEKPKMVDNAQNNNNVYYNRPSLKEGFRFRVAFINIKPVLLLLPALSLA